MSLMAAPFRLGSLAKAPEQLEALDRVKEWTRERFTLPPDAAILVSEVACGNPGCPPLETVVAFWPDAERRQFKLFKRAVEVVEDDLPPRWMKDALLPPEAFGLGCC
jgi:nitrate reductase delta subunit